MATTDSAGTPAQDVVGIFDSNFRQLVQAARPMRASVSPSARLMTHPKEDGALIADHRVFDPLEIEIAAVLTPEEYRAAYQQLRDVFYGTETVTVQTRTAAYDNMVMVALPHEETTEMANTIPVFLRFQEVLIIKAQFQALPRRAVRSADDTSAANRGEQSTTTPPAERQSKLFSIIRG